MSRVGTLLVLSTIRMLSKYTFCMLLSAAVLVVGGSSRFLFSAGNETASGSVTAGVVTSHRRHALRHNG